MISLSLLHALWWVLFLLIATGVLMLSYWIVTRERLSFLRALMIQMGLFLVNAFLSLFISVMPLRELLWLALVALYFMWMLRISFWRALLVTLLQRVIYFVFVFFIFVPAFVVTAP